MTGTVEFVLPSLGADMESGIVVSWAVAPGDLVERGDVVVIVETDKGEIDVEIWQSGVVEELLVGPGAEVPVGAPLARLRREGVAPPGMGSPPVATAPLASPGPEASAVPPEPRTVTVVAAPVTATTTADPPAVPAGGGASPLARRIAVERGIDLHTIIGTGPGGAVIARDLPETRETASAQRAPTNPAEAMRRAIATTMSRANREIPHYYLAADIDLEASLCWLEDRNAARPVAGRVLPVAVILAAIARALASHPALNGWWIDGEHQPSNTVDLGVATSLRSGGLVVPVIADAASLTVEELMERLRDLVARARAGRLRASEVAGASATVTNLGDRGVDVVHGVIHPPQVALVGVGRIAARPTVVDGGLTVGRQSTISLAADHRASDGDMGARFVRTIDHLLQRPEEL